MNVNKTPLGKVSVTCAGRWNKDKAYDRITIVYNELYGSYISVQDVPKGMVLENELFWQPLASFKDDLVIDYIEFKRDFLIQLAKCQADIKKGRKTVNTEADKDALTILDISVGCEVYVVETKRTYILESIQPEINQKLWHLEAEGRIDSEPSHELSGTCEYLTAQRAIADALGNIIHEKYLARGAAKEYVIEVISKFLQQYDINIPAGTITPEMLSQGVIDMIASKGVVSNSPDEEDLTAKEISNTVSVLSFKDKNYEEGKFTGLGRVYLRRNMAGQLNLLEQRLINKPNTIYVIQYDYCLDNKTITIPENSVLLFKGGSFNRGTVVLNNTKIEGIFNIEEGFRNVTIEGTYKEGQVLYDVDLKKNKLYNGTQWVNLDGSNLV